MTILTLVVQVSSQYLGSCSLPIALAAVVTVDFLVIAFIIDGRDIFPFLFIILPHTEPLILPFLTLNHKLHWDCNWVSLKIIVLSSLVLLKIYLNFTLRSGTVNIKGLDCDADVSPITASPLLVAVSVWRIGVEEFRTVFAGFSSRNLSNRDFKLSTASLFDWVISPTIRFGSLPCRRPCVSSFGTFVGILKRKIKFTYSLWGKAPVSWLIPFLKKICAGNFIVFS